MSLKHAVAVPLLVLDDHPSTRRRPSCRRRCGSSSSHCPTMPPPISCGRCSRHWRSGPACSTPSSNEGRATHCSPRSSFACCATATYWERPTAPSGCAPAPSSRSRSQFNRCSPPASMRSRRHGRPSWATLRSSARCSGRAPSPRWGNARPETSQRRSTGSSRVSSYALCSGPRSRTSPSTPSATSSPGTSRTRPCHAPAAPRDTLPPRPGSNRRPATASRTSPRSSPITTSSPRTSGCDRR